MKYSLGFLAVILFSSMGLANDASAHLGNVITKEGKLAMAAVVTLRDATAKTTYNFLKESSHNTVYQFPNNCSQVVGANITCAEDRMSGGEPTYTCVLRVLENGSLSAANEAQNRNAIEVLCPQNFEH